MHKIILLFALASFCFFTQRDAHGMNDYKEPLIKIEPALALEPSNTVTDSPKQKLLAAINKNKRGPAEHYIIPIRKKNHLDFTGLGLDIQKLVAAYLSNDWYCSKIIPTTEPTAKLQFMPQFGGKYIAANGSRLIKIINTDNGAIQHMGSLCLELFALNCLCCKDKVVDFDFSPDMKYLAVGTAGRCCGYLKHDSIQLFNTETHERDYLKNVAPGIRSLRFSNNNELTSLASDGTIRIWDNLAAGEQNVPFGGGPVPERMISLRIDIENNDKLCVAGLRNIIYVFRVSNQNNIRSINLATPAQCFALSHDKKFLAVGSQNTITLIKIEPTNQASKELAVQGNVQTLCFARNGLLAAAISKPDDVGITIFTEPFSSEKTDIISLDTRTIHQALNFSPDCSTLASADRDGNVHLWKIKSEIILQPKIKKEKLNCRLTCSIWLQRNPCAISLCLTALVMIEILFIVMKTQLSGN